MQLAGEPLILRPTPRRCFETRSLPPDQFPLAYSPKQPGAALGRLEVDHADHQRTSDRVSRIPPTPSSSAREGFGPFDTDQNEISPPLPPPFKHQRAKEFSGEGAMNRRDFNRLAVGAGLG